MVAGGRGERAGGGARLRALDRERADVELNVPAHDVPEQREGRRQVEQLEHLRAVEHRAPCESGRGACATAVAHTGRPSSAHRRVLHHAARDPHVRAELLRLRRVYPIIT